MSFRFYIIDLYNGTIFGTNVIEKAENFAESEDYFVIEPEENLWYLEDGTTKDIPAVK